MKIKNNGAGFIINIIIGIALIGGALFFAWSKSAVILSFNSAKRLYNKGYYFTSASKHNEDSLYAVAVHDIIDTGYGSSDGDSEVYTLRSDDGVYFLEANPTNKKIKSMLEVFDKYAKDENNEGKEAPVDYLVVEVKQDTYNQLPTIADEIDPDRTYRANGTLYDTFYLSNTSLTTETVFAVGGTILLFVIGIGFIIAAVNRKSANSDNYERLCALDERLRDNLGELDNISDYVDKSLGAYVYKDFLILNTKFGLDMYNLNNLVWLYHRITKHKMYLVITVGTDFSLQINLYENGKLTEHNVKISNKKSAESSIEALVSYIAMHYPNALAGFSPEAREAYKEFKLSHK